MALTSSEKRLITMRRMAREKLYEESLRLEWEHIRTEDPSIAPWENQAEWNRKAMLTGFTLAVQHFKRRAEKKRDEQNVSPASTKQPN
jgi:hypothetical protein